MSSHYPDGIEQGHHDHPRFWRRNAGPVSLIVLGALLAAALLGLFGGQPNSDLVAETPEVRLEVNSATVLRNGLFFETRIRITAKRPIDELVLGIAPSLWRDLTINSMFPAASEEESRDGMLRFSYGPAEAGQTIEIKIDGQVNPPLFGGTGGDVAVFDGDLPLARLPVTRKVRP